MTKKPYITAVYPGCRAGGAWLVCSSVPYTSLCSFGGKKKWSHPWKWIILPLSSRKIVRISPTDPAFCCHHLSLLHLSELWLQDVVLKSRETQNWRGAEGWWWCEMIPQGTERQGRAPVQLSQRELNKTEQRWVEQGEQSGGAGSSHMELSPASKMTARGQNWQGPKPQSSRAVQCNTDDPAFGNLSVCHCFLWSWAQGWEVMVAGNSLHPVHREPHGHNLRGESTFLFLSQGSHRATLRW